MMRLALAVLFVTLIVTACATTDKNPVITSTVAKDDGSVELTWDTNRGSQYQVLSSMDPAAPEEEWTVETTITAKSGKTVWTDKAVSGDKAKFYRIREVSTPEKM